MTWLRKTFVKRTLKRLITTLAVAGLLSVSAFDHCMHANNLGSHALAASADDGGATQHALGGGCHSKSKHSRLPSVPTSNGDKSPQDDGCPCCAAAHCFVFLAPAADPIDIPWSLASIANSKSIYAAPTPPWRLDRPPKNPRLRAEPRRDAIAAVLFFG